MVNSLVTRKIDGPTYKATEKLGSGSVFEMCVYQICKFSDLLISLLFPFQIKDVTEKVTKNVKWEVAGLRGGHLGEQVCMSFTDNDFILQICPSFMRVLSCTSGDHLLYLSTRGSPFIFYIIRGPS